MEANEDRLPPLLQEIRTAVLRNLARLAALIVAGTVLLGLVLLVTPIRVPLGGGDFGVALIDVGALPGSGPLPGWYSGPLLAIRGSSAPVGAYSAYFGREWGVLLQFPHPGLPPTRRYRQPTRFITEHPLAGMLLHRVEAGRVNRARLQQLLGPPTHRMDTPESGSEWRYDYPNWTGGFLFHFDRHGTARRLDVGSC